MGGGGREGERVRERERERERAVSPVKRLEEREEACHAFY